MNAPAVRKTVVWGLLFLFVISTLGPSVIAQASWGENAGDLVKPIQQALGWIVDIFSLDFLGNDPSRYAGFARAAMFIIAFLLVLTTFVIGGLLVAVLFSLGVAGYFAIRWKLAEQRQVLLPEHRRRKVLPRSRKPEMIIMESDDEPVSLDGVDLAQWGW